MTAARAPRQSDIDAIHAYARETAADMQGITMKLVRWNDIVEVAFDFYPLDPKAGVRECLDSCCPDNSMFDGKNTLAVSLRNNYAWMLT